MTNNLSFDDVARNLLVFLKGQVPSLTNKSNKDEVLRQVQSIVFTLRSTIVQLEGATYNENFGNEDHSELLNQIDELKKHNAKLEELNIIEKNRVKELNEKLANSTLSEFSDNERTAYEDVLHKQKIENEKLRKENIKFKSEYERYKSEYEKYRNEHDKLKQQLDDASMVPMVEESVVIDLKAQLAELESSYNESKTDVAALKQALQNKEIELSKSKDAILDAMNHEKSEIERYREKLQDFEVLKAENLNLRKEIEGLQKDVSMLPSKEEYQNYMTSMTTKLKFLEESLFNSQTELKKAQEQLSEDNPNGLLKEKAMLEQKVANLEETLHNVIAAREADAANAKNNFVFNPDECIFLFETLSTTVRRLKENIENKDIFLRSKESITILEKAKAISKIQTVGQQLDTRIHKVTKAFIADFLPDEMIIFEESAGFVSGNKLIQKAVVWITKSKFVCSECGKVSKPHELFCPQCGYELTAADGTSKRDLPPYPTSLEVNLPLLDEMMKQGNVKASTKIMSIISKVSPNNPDVVKKQAILSRVDPNFSMYQTY